MPQRTGQNRDQTEIFCLEQQIASDNEVRLVDAFVDSLDLSGMGFALKGDTHTGRPAYSAGLLLKIYLYGYLNRIRSSRKLARACQTNVELWWLTGRQQPCYKTICDFRKDNSQGLREVFRAYNELLKSEGLFGGEVVAIDGSKFRAQNSMKNNYNQKKIDRHKDYIDAKTEEYLLELANADEEEWTEKVVPVTEKLAELRRHKSKYEALESQLKESEQTQISTVDPDARALPQHKNIVEVGYNVQSAVDEKHKLVVHQEVTNVHDTDALHGMAKASKEVLEVDHLRVLADKGYHTGSELKACAEDNIKTYVAPRQHSSGGKKRGFRKADFDYDPGQDAYKCPAGQILPPKGNRYTKHGGGRKRKAYTIQRYECPVETCRACPFAAQCGPFSRGHGRIIERTEYDHYVAQNKARVQSSRELYRRRQQIVEHPFGTIKRQWGYDHTLLRGLDKVGAEFALIFTCYNLRRSVSILGVPRLLKALETWKMGLFSFFQCLMVCVSSGTLKLNNNWSRRVVCNWG